MQRFAQELVALQPDLILSNNTPTTAAMLRQTRTIPIIFASVADPVGSGFVASLSRPGGNVEALATADPCFVVGLVTQLADPDPAMARD